MTSSDLLDRLRSTPEFRQIVLALLRTRPSPLEYKPGTLAEDELYMANVRYRAGMRAGWDLLFTHLTGKTPDQLVPGTGEEQ